MSLATYALAAYLRRGKRPAEAAFKYLVLGAISSALFLYGSALLYGSTGSTLFSALKSVPADRVPLHLAGLALVAAGVAFKIAAVPFHAWAPDVYEGAPTPVTAFMTVGPKAAGFAALVRLLVEAFPSLEPNWTALLWFSAVLSMTVGNVLAVLQTNVKRRLEIGRASCRERV